jgi:hypothetical protein
MILEEEGAILVYISSRWHHLIQDKILVSCGLSSASHSKGRVTPHLWRVRWVDSVEHCHFQGLIHSQDIKLEGSSTLSSQPLTQSTWKLGGTCCGTQDHELASKLDTVKSCHEIRVLVHCIDKEAIKKEADTIAWPEITG